MNQKNQLLSKTLVFKYNNSSGIKEADVAKIEAALGLMKNKGNASIASEVQQENRMYFEYHIEFPSAISTN